MLLEIIPEISCANCLYAKVQSSGRAKCYWDLFTTIKGTRERDTKILTEYYYRKKAGKCFYFDSMGEVIDE